MVADRLGIPERKGDHFPLLSIGPTRDATSSRTTPEQRSPIPSERNGRLSPDASSRKGISGTYQTILWATLVVTVPLLIIIGLLVYMVVAFKVDRKALSEPSLRLPSDRDDPNAYFVDIDAARFVTISSWASSVASLLPGFVMSLCSFHVSRKLLNKAEKDEVSKLPTPYQLGLLLETLDAQLLSLWDVISYWLWKTRRPFSSMLRLAASLLAITTVLSYAIWAVDTWLHVVTESVIISQVSPSDPPQHSFGFEFLPECTGIRDTGDYSDNLPYTCRALFFGQVNQTQDPYLIMNNLSSTYQILKETQDQDSFSFLAPVRPPLDIDYSASTLAASSACEPYSRQCNLRLAGDDISSVFNCSDNFNGANPGVSNSNISIPDWPNCGDWGCIYLFSDAGLNNTDNLNKSNPFYAGVQGHIRQHQLDWQQTLAHDPEILSAFWQYYFILRCEIKIHNLTYSWVNGSMASKTLSLVNNSDVLEVSSWLLEEGIVADQLAYMLQLATVISNTSQEIADYYAAQLEMVTLAASAGFFQPKPNMKEQVRRPVLVTRVPKAPLFFLWSLCILYVLLGLGLAVSITATHPAAYRDVQARLSIFGLVASRFESGAGKRVTEIGDLFEERTGTSSVHVGIVKTEEGGWNYASEGC